MSAITWKSDGERWQKTFSLGQRKKGTYLVTKEIMSNIQEGIKDVKIGMLYLFLQHTSAALSINENADPDVRVDMTEAVERIVPADLLEWEHNDEGIDDSSSHVKCSIFGANVTIPITNGRLNFGTWQGIYLLEFRDDPHVRRIVATII